MLMMIGRQRKQKRVGWLGQVGGGGEVWGEEGEGRGVRCGARRVRGEG